MARIDVTEVLLDPDFLDRLYCFRNAQTMGEDGRASINPQKLPIWGVVTTDSGDRLERGADGERIAGNITIHTRFRLSDGKDGYTADIVEFCGKQYTVSNVSDYSHFGRGFVSATADLIPLSG